METEPWVFVLRYGKPNKEEAGVNIHTHKEEYQKEMIQKYDCSKSNVFYYRNKMYKVKV